VRKTSKIFQGQPVFKAENRIGANIRKGDQIYLDNLHNDHLEVFDRFGDVRLVLNLDGSINPSKTKKAVAAGRKLR
jgi:filamentous hemagglutinin